MSSSSSTSSTDKLGWSDRHFVSKTAEGNQDEVQLAQLAAQRASNPDVRNYAQKLVSDHSSMATEIASIATAKDVKLDLDDSPSREYKRLSKKSEADFDHEFLDHMVDEHEKDIKAFEKASADAKDSAVRDFATKHLADLRQHLATAQNLEQVIMPTGRANANDTNASGSSTMTPSTSTTTDHSSTTPKTETSPGAGSPTQ